MVNDIIEIRVYPWAKDDAMVRERRPGNIIWVPLKTVLLRDGGVSLVLRAFGAHSEGCTLRDTAGKSALCTVRPYVFAYTLRFCARGFLALTKNSWFLKIPIYKNSILRRRFRQI